MAISNFNPTLWSKGLLVNFNKAHVHGDVMNRDYQGEFGKYGDTVKINSIGRITAKSYVRNAGMGGTGASPTIAAIDRPEIVNGSSLFLAITDSDYINFGIDDLDKIQQTPKLMDDVAREAAYALDNRADVFCNSTLQTGVSGTTGGTGNRLAPRTVGPNPGDGDAYELLVDLGVKLDEQDVFGDRWIILPPWYIGVLRKDVRFTGNGTTENMAILKNGKVPNVTGFDIRQSNNLSGTTAGTLAVSGGPYTILAGIKAAATYAEYVPAPEAFRPQDGRNDAMKIFHDYGAKVIRPYGLASCAVTQAT